jgi:hypothetical protein
MKAETLKIVVKIEPAAPTPAQLKQWQELWRKLLEGQKQAAEAATGQGEGNNGSSKQAK